MAKDMRIDAGDFGLMPVRQNGDSSVNGLVAEVHLPLTFTKKKRVYEAPAPLAPIADTHAHLLSFWGKDPVDALVRAALAGDRMLITLLDPIADGLGVSEFHDRLTGWIAAARSCLRESSTPDAAAMLDRVHYLCGVHPYGAPDYTNAVHARVEKALDDPLCVGVGEIGLDYHFDHDDDVAPAPHDVQIACMERQLDLAVRHNVPVELHLRHENDDEDRTSHTDAYNVLIGTGIPEAGCVLHCFGEDRATMERFTDLGCYIAFGGAATFKRNNDIREAFAVCPLDKILFETDCPYMAPEPIRGLECEPAMIAFTVDALVRDRAARTGEEPEAIAQAAWDNAIRLFER